MTPVPGIVLGLVFATFTLVACASTGGSSANEGGSGGTSSGGSGAISGGNAGHAGLGGDATGGAGSPGGAGGRTTTGGGGNAASGGAAASAGVAATGGDPSIPVGGEPLCPADDWCWEHPLPQGNNLTGVSGTASDDVWVVGEEGTILHWDGQTLRPLSSETFDGLTGVWAASPQEAWISNALGAFLRWDGKQWSAAAGQPTDIQSAAAVTGSVERIGGAPVSTVWFAAAMTPIQLSAGAWNASAPNPAFFATAAWADAKGAIWMGGNGGHVAVLRDGAWSSIGSGLDSRVTIRAIGGDPQGNVWVVGDGGAIARIDERGVAATFTSGVSADLRGIWAARFDDAWAVGASGTMLHFDGARWQKANSGTDFDLRAIWGAAANDVWAVGARGVLLHYDGSAWTPPNGATAVKLNATWGASLEDVWAVGDEGVVLRRRSGRWQSVASPTKATLTSVWGAGPSDVWIGGDVVLHWDGTALSVHDGLPTAGALSGLAADDLWANAQGAASHWGGKTWTALTRRIAGSIFEAAPDDLWVASIDGEASAGHWDGQAQSWTKWPLADCKALHGSGAKDVWCVGGGASARVQHWSGAAWLELTSPTRPGLLAVASSGANQIWFAGGSGALGHCDGASCTSRGTVGGTSADKFARGAFVAEDLTGLTIVGEDVFVVGTRGAILRRHL